MKTTRTQYFLAGFIGALVFRPMSNRFFISLALVLWLFFAYNSTSYAQQKGQWQPGQFGLNAGVIPDPGITYVNMPHLIPCDVITPFRVAPSALIRLDELVTPVPLNLPPC